MTMAMRMKSERINHETPDRFVAGAAARLSVATTQGPFAMAVSFHCQTSYAHDAGTRRTFIARAVRCYCRDIKLFAFSQHAHDALRPQ